MTVDELLDRMSPSEFADWRAYDDLYPIGDLRTEIEYARLKFMLVSMMSEEGKGPEGVDEFLWSFRLTPAAKEKVLQKRASQMILAAFGFSKGG